MRVPAESSQESQSPQNGAFIPTPSGTLSITHASKSQSPQNGAFIPTRRAEIREALEVEVSIPSKRGLHPDYVPESKLTEAVALSQSPQNGAFIPTHPDV